MLIDPTAKPETIRRRAKAPVVNTAMSMHDDYIRVNAKLRNDLGLKPILQRFGTGCCSWCSAVAGKWRFGEQPDDVFRRHDNCDCVIIYDTQVLRGVKTQDGGRSKTWTEVDPSDLQTDPPKVFSQAEAEQLQENAVSRLTLAGERDILRTRMATDSDFTLRGNVYTISEDPKAVKAAEQYAKEVLSAGIVDFTALKNGEVIMPLLERLGSLKEKHDKHFFQIFVDKTMDDLTFAEVAPDLSLHLNANFMNSAAATSDLLESLSAKKLLPNSHRDTEYMITHEFMHFVSRSVLEDPRSKVYKILPKTENTKFLGKNAASRNSCKNVHEFTADALSMAEYGHDENNVWNKLYQFFFGGAT